MFSEFIGENLFWIVIFFIGLLLYNFFKGNKKVSYIRKGVISIIREKNLTKIDGKTFDFESTYLHGLYFVKVGPEYINLTRENTSKYLTNIRLNKIELYFSPLQRRL